MTRVSHDASRWHSIKRRHSSKAHRVISALVSIAVAAGMLIGVAQAANADTRYTYDFNSGALADNFNSYATSSASSVSVNGGIGGTGAASTQAITGASVAKNGFSFSSDPVGTTYSMSAFAKSVGTGGYGSIGFTSYGTPASGNFNSSNGYMNDAVGLYFHGGGYTLLNGSEVTSGCVWQTACNTVTTVTLGTSDAVTSTTVSPDRWYKFVVRITKKSATTFDLRLELYSSTANGVASASAVAAFDWKGKTNSAFLSATEIYPYFAQQGSRVYFWDNFTSVQTNSPEIEPDAPTITSITPGGSKLSVNFTAGTNSGSEITAYQYSTDSGATWADPAAPTVASPLVIAKRSDNAATLVNLTSYNVQIRAVNRISGAASATMAGIPEGIATAPVIDGVVSTTSSMSVAFSGATTNGGTAITKYQYSTDGGATWRDRDTGTTVSPLEITTTSADNTPIALGTSYGIQIRGFNTVPGTASATKTAGPDAAPGAPTITGISLQNAQLVVSFTAGSNTGTAIQTYHYSTDDGLTWRKRGIGTTSTSFAFSTTSTTGISLTNGVNYKVRVRAVNWALGDPSEVFEAMPESPPLAPTNIVITPSSTQLSIAYTASDRNGGSAITKYQYSTDGGATWRDRDSGTTASPLVITTTSADNSALVWGTTYPIQIRAYNTGAGTASMSINSGLDIAPDAPSIDTITSGSQRLKINFTAGTNSGTAIQKYQYSTDGGVTWRDRAGGGTSSPITATTISGAANTSLVNGTSYNVQIRACNWACGTATSTTAATPIDIAPEAPVITSVVGTGVAGTLSAAFTQVNDGSAITKYEYSTDGGTTWRNRASGTNASPILISTTSASNGALVNGTTYPIQIRAVNTGFTSASSNSIDAIPDTTLAAPTGLLYTIGYQKITVSFNAPSAGTGTAIQKYQYTTNNGVTWKDASTGSPIVVTTTSDTNTQLINGTSYSFGIRAYNYLPGTSSTISTRIPAETAPPAPTISSVTPGDKQLVVAFTQTTNAGSDIVKYQYTTDSGNTYTDILSTTSPFVITKSSGNSPVDFVNGTSWRVGIRAFNTIPGSVSYWANFVAPDIAPGVPTVTSITPSSGKLTVAFTAGSNSGSSLTKYQYSTDGGLTWRDRAAGTTATPIDITTTSAANSSLVNGTSYDVQIRAFNTMAGAASTTTRIAPEVAPGAPTMGAITAGDSQLSVAFTAGANTGSAITTYQYSTDGGVTWRDRATGTTASPIVITTTSSDNSTLVNGTSYSIKIRAFNTMAGTAVTTATNATPIYSPGPPTGISITPGNAQLSVAFTAGANLGTSITKYQYSTDGGVTWRDRTGGGTASPIVITTTSAANTNLINGTSYDVQIRAFNTIAGAATITTSTAPDVTPGAPTGISITPGNAQLSIAFTAGTNTGSTITKYQYSTDGGVTWRDRATGTTASPIVVTTISGEANTNLINGTSYDVQIRAINTLSGLSTATQSITPISPPLLAAVSAQSLTQGAAFNLAAPANTGGSATSWSISAGSLAAGLTLDTSTGVISGTPTTAESFTATLSATNSVGSGSTEISGTVAAVIPPALGSVTDKVFTMGDLQAFTIPNSGDAATFAVTSGTLPSGFALNTTTGVISGTGTADDSERSITVTATNYTGSSTATFKMTVNRAPPILSTTTSAQVLNRGSAYSLSAIGNTGGQVATWSATGLPSGITIDSSTGEISGTPTTVGSATDATITATNSGGSSSVQVSFRVDPALTPVLVNPGNQVLTVGDQNYSLQIVNTGGDGTWTVTSGTLPAGLSINAVTGEISGVPTTEAISSAVTINATNPNGSNDSVTFNFTIVLPIPDFSQTSSRTYLQGDTVSLLPPTNTGGAVATWSATGLPAGLTIDSSTGLITGTASTSQSAADATITATNSGGEVTYTQSFTVTAMAPPSLSAVADIRLTVDTPYTLQFSNSGYTSTWSATGLPTGFSIDPATGDITGSSTVEVSSRQVTITAQNYAGTDSETFAFAVVQAVPAIGSISAQTLILGSAASISAPTNSGGPVATWSATGLPSGLSINSNTGAITGTPTALQSATDATVSATNSGGTVDRTVSFTVNDITPVLGTLAAITLDRNTAMTPVSAPANTGGPVVSWSSSDLPSGLTIDSVTGQITGTPTDFQAATTSHVVATNSGGSDTATISITIKDERPLLEPFATPFYFTNGVAITPFTPTNNGGAATSWTVDNLPNGLSLNTSTGEISGTPVGLDAGHTATMFAYNSGGGHGVTFSYFVNAVIPNLSAMNSVTVNKGVAITAISAPTNSGGTVVTWSASGLPAGLAINSGNGLITGTPTTVATATTVTISGTNTGGTSTTTITITVEDSAPGAPTITSISSTNQKLTVNFTVGINVGTSISKYQYSTDGGLSWRDRATGTTGSPIEITTISGDDNSSLVNGESYDIQIRAVNSLIGIATATTEATPNDLPGSPTNVTSVLSGTTVQISWTAASGSVDSYTVTSNVGNFRCTVNAPATSCFIYGLTNGTSYTFTATASNNAGTSSPSSATSSITPDIAPGAPSITGIAISGQQMSVAFVFGNNLGSSISTYQYSTDGGSTWRDRSTGTTGTPLVITTISGAGNSSLDNGVSYNVQIRAFNTKEGTASGTTTATPDVAPGAPTIDSLTPGNGSLSIAFTAGTNNGSTVTKYQYTTDGSNYKDLVGTTSPITISTISGITNTALANGSEYTIRIRARNTLTGSASTSVLGIPDVRPGAPTIASVTSSDSQLSVAFDAASNSGSAITKYQYSTDGGSTWRDRASGTGSPLVISRDSDTNTSLVNGTTYSITLRAVNTLNGVASTAVDGTPDMVPQTISDLVGTSADAQVDLTWTAPTGTPINDYIIEYSPNSGVSYVTFSHAASTASSISVTGLTNGTAYLFRISAVNGTSVSEPVTSISVTPRANQATLNWGMSDTAMPYLGTLTLSTTGGSGTGSVIYSVTGSASCAIASNILTAGEVGSSCQITATKQMAGPYNAASTSSRTISVTKIAQAETISFTNSNTVQFGNTLNVKAIGGSGSGSIEYSVDNAGNTGCSINPSTGELTVSAAGTCRVGAKRDTSNNYRDYLEDYVLPTQDITVTTANQSIAFTSIIPTNPLAGDTYSLTGASSANLPVSFTIDSGACTVSNTVVTFTSSGSCVIKGSQAGDNQYSPAVDVYQTVAVGQRNQILTYSASTLARTTVTYGDPTFLVTANSTEASAVVTFTLGSATTNSACLVTTEGLVSVLAVGICAVQADATGTSAFAAASPIVQTIYVLPAAAGAPFITSIAGGNQAITLNFTAPSYDGGSSISGYQLVAIPQTVGYDTVYESGCSTTLSANDEATCTVRGLRNGVHYKVKVAALTSAGLGTYSDLSRSLQVATNPSAVQSLRVTQSNAQLVINWSDPESLGGGDFISYRIFIKLSAAANYDSSNYFEESDDSLQTFTATKLSPVGANLVNGVAYDIKIVTVTTANSLELSANTAVVNQIPRTVPDSPRFNNAIIMGNEVVLIWQSPVSDGGAEISAYSAQVASNACVLDNPADTFCTAPKPAVGGNYGYQIRAFNVAGSSDPATGTVQLGTPPVVVPPVSPTPVPPAPVVKVDPDDVVSGSITDEKVISGKSGTAKLPDGSEISISSKGVITPKVRTGYIGTITGTMTVSYLDKAKKKQVTYKCPKSFKFGTTKKNPKAKIDPKTKKYVKILYISKVGCTMPAAAMAAAKVGKVKIVTNLTFVRLWPTTGKPLTPGKKKISPIKRKITITLGK